MPALAAALLASGYALAAGINSTLVCYDCKNGNSAGSYRQCGFCDDEVDGPKGAGTNADCQACCNSFDGEGTVRNERCRTLGGCS
ncbi:MAG: hypothetical protein D6693_10600 [Planctomycetota bacterium]|nr:MAG: hypothetical protein D6693_10600 [Planctomycetota bacterium]